jgi:hypothetical protein
MSKKLIALFAIFAVVALLSVAGLKADEMKMGDKGMADKSMGSWTGEVIDVACHSAKGAGGASHMECGAKCVKEGLPVGLLVNGTTYLLIGADHKPLNATLADHVSHTVTVTGTKFESPGANLIEVKDWKMASK